MAITNFFVQDGLNVNNFIIANNTILKVGTNVVINTTALYIGNNVGLFLASNGSLGSNGYVLTSNGTTVYWSLPAAGVNTAATYTWTNTHTFNSNVTFGTSAGLIANTSIGTNGQFLASNGTTIYWTAPVAAAAAGGANTNVQFANGTAIAGNANLSFDYTTGQLFIGQGGFAFSTVSSLAVTKGNVNTYIEKNVQNANTGTAASGDFIVTADSGNNTIDYIDLGINSSTYNQASFSIVGAKDGYLYTSNGHLSIGTAVDKEVRIHANGTTSNALVVAANAQGLTIANTMAIFANASAGANGSVLISNGSAISWSPLATITWAAATGQTWF